MRLRDKVDIEYTNTMVLIKGINKVVTGKGEIPTVLELYPDLFDKEIEEQKRLDNSIKNFMNFAHAFNKRFRKKGN